MRTARKIAPPGVFIQIEVETLDDLRSALDAGAKLVLLDNFDLGRMCEAVILNARLTNRAAALEASGGITLDNVRAVAETGVDRISVGSLTKDIKAVDLSMRFSPARLRKTPSFGWGALLEESPKAVHFPCFDSTNECFYSLDEWRIDRIESAKYSRSGGIIERGQAVYNCTQALKHSFRYGFSIPYPWA